MSNLVHNLTNSPNLVERIKGIDRDIDKLKTWKQDTLTAWSWITIDEDNVISSTWAHPEWWNIEWDIHDQTDLMEIIWDGSEILSQWAYDDLPVEKQEDWTLYLIYWLWGSETEEVLYWADVSLSFNDSTSVLTAWLLDQNWDTLWTPKSVTIPAWWVSPDDVNTKTFYISDRDDLTNAQAALDWFLLWKNPIIAFNGKRYFVWYKTNSSLWFFGWDYSQRNRASWISWLWREWVVISYSGDTVTNISPWWLTYEINSYLATWVNYHDAYIPEYPWSPATKKYVDDKSSTIPSWSTAPSNPTTWTIWYDTTNNIVKIYNWTTWIEIWWNPQSWSTEPVNPQEWDLWYDTVNHVLKIYNWTSWKTIDTNTTYTAWNGINISAQDEISIDTSVVATQSDIPTTVAELSDSNDYATKTYADSAASSAASWVNWIITWQLVPPASSQWEGRIFYCTFDNTFYKCDWTAWTEVWSWTVDDTAFWISWDWDTTHAPSKNAIYDVLWNVQTLLANL